MHRIIAGPSWGSGLYLEKCAITPDGSYVLRGHQDGRTSIHRSLTGEEVRVIDGVHTRAVSAIAVTSDGKRAATGYGGCTTKLWSMETGEVLRCFQSDAEGGYVCSVVITPDDRYIIVGMWIAYPCGDESGIVVEIWCIETCKVVRQFCYRASSSVSLAVAPDCEHLVISLSGTTVELRSISSGELINHLRYGTIGLYAVAVTPDNQNVIICGWEGLCVWPMAADSRVRKSRGVYMASATSICFTPDGRFIITTLMDGCIRIWSLADLEPVCRINVSRDSVSMARLATNGSRIVSVSSSSVCNWYMSHHYAALAELDDILRLLSVAVEEEEGEDAEDIEGEEWGENDATSLAEMVISAFLVEHAKVVVANTTEERYAYP